MRGGAGFICYRVKFLQDVLLGLISGGGKTKVNTVDEKNVGSPKS